MRVQVVEVQPPRQFDVTIPGQAEPSRVIAGQTGILYCARHKTLDGCECTSRVRLSGLLTNSVRDIRDRKPIGSEPLGGFPSPELQAERKTNNERRASEVGL